MTDGDLLWSFPTTGNIKSSPAIAQDGTIYIESFDGNLYAINPNGTQKWTSSINGTDQGLILGSSPIIAQDGTIYIGSTDNSVYAIEGSSHPLYYPSLYFEGILPSYLTMRRNQDPVQPNIISSTLTVDKTDCTELCTVNGTVSWKIMEVPRVLQQI